MGKHVTGLSRAARHRGHRWAAATTSLVVAAAIGAVGAAGPASASGERATHGDAEAVLRAFEDGGWAALLRGGTTMAAPGDDPFDAKVQIRPFDFFGGRHYCSLDWHMVGMADFEGGDRSFTRDDAENIISDLRMDLDVDGAALSLTQTPVARFLNPEGFGLEEAYWSQWGAVLSPEQLRAGEHTLHGRLTDGSGDVLFENTISVVIDPPGSGACL